MRAAPQTSSQRPRTIRRPRATVALPHSTSAEDYLERIHDLIENKGYARMVDIAHTLGVSQPSVTAMAQKLADGGFLNYEKYRGLRLTPQGQKVALRIKKRHALLKRFLSLLGLDEDTQEQDIEGLEHSLSPETLARLTELTRFLEQRPQLLAEFARRAPPDKAAEA
jgi:Mn-dependent DtxR family transcriptional regulator